MRVLKGIVKYAAGPPREGQYGQSINILVTLDEGYDVRVYGKPGDPIEQLKAKQPVQLIEDKGKYKLIEEEAPAQQPQPTEKTEKPDMRQIIHEMETLYSDTFIDIFNAMISAGIPIENATAATSTIFIQIFQKLR